MFVDEVKITVIAGGGGHGCMSFRREKFIPHGGPDGGDGGNGGNIILVADDSLNTLHHLAGKHHWRAERGIHGMGKKRHGRCGEDVVIPVPPGTIIFDNDHGILLRDLTDPNQRVVVAKGGTGGKGNTRFRTATNQAPRDFEKGTPGQERNLRLELKLIADVGLVGKPNAGKSTLLSRLSAARPKIADYPFTTLTPFLGIVELSGYRRYVMADLPGLIEGAHTGAGLGDEFLRHVERTRLLVHMVDISPVTGSALEDYETISNELEQYSSQLGDKPKLIVANKMDLTESEEHLAEFGKEFGAEIIPISAVTGKGLDTLQEKIWAKLQEMDRE
ncbi:MAG: GTPase ObgE [Phycisphaerae bacterium]|nr:GTPase ObgE [Phycisphaerae bacterium]